MYAKRSLIISIIFSRRCLKNAIPHFLFFLYHIMSAGLSAVTITLAGLELYYILHCFARKIKICIHITEKNFHIGEKTT